MTELHPPPAAWTSGAVFLGALAIAVFLEALGLPRRPSRKKPRR